ncbi:MAG: hypothetical protein L6R40_002214 [Gallowayella cf. fulva]|nr:MAG: hypothetical protein L6R40_002214 [Xanthomendoza cf. fulva]
MTTPSTEHACSPPPFSKASPFRFKRKRSGDISASNPPPLERRSHSPSSSNRTHRHHRHHRRRHHRSRHHRSPIPDSTNHIDPEIAFRESLFDALADDEGAAYWESVYGQPIHTYSPYIPSASDDPEQAKLQRMTDDEYATFVRARMWEKTHGHIVEERRRREEEITRRKEREAQGRKWEREVEEPLRRGEEKRRKNRWKDAWGRYLQGWEALAASHDRQGGHMREQIPWPVESGRCRHVNQEQVEMFFKHAPQPKRPNEGLDLVGILKAERVRWHPDKFLQRAGGGHVDTEIITMVTAVFQIIDRLWSDMRPA